MVEGRAVNTNMYGFSGNMFTVLVSYLEVEDVGSRQLLEKLCM